MYVDVELPRLVVVLLVAEHLDAGALELRLVPVLQRDDVALHAGDEVLGDLLGAPEVEERDAPAAEEAVVARVRVRVEQAVLVERAEHESPDRLARRVAVGLWRALAERLVVDAPDELAREHPPRGERVVHARDDDLAVAARGSS